MRYSLLDLYRILLQNIPDAELNDAFKENYLPLGRIFYARDYPKLLQLSRELSAVWSELPNHRFSLLQEFIEQVHSATKNYPTTPEGITGWTKSFDDIFDDYLAEIKLG